jgi:hypothetical protein
MLSIGISSTVLGKARFVFAQVAELVDALASGASVCMDVEVQVLSWAPYEHKQ